DPVQTDHERAPEAVVLARPGSPRVAIIEDARLAKPHQPDQPAQEPVALLERHHVVDHAAAHEPEVTRVRWYLDVGDALYQPVADGGDDALGDSLARACPPLCIHDVVALAPAHDQLGDQLGRVLQIAVDHHHRIAARGIEPGDRRHWLTE